MFSSYERRRMVAAFESRSPEKAPKLRDDEPANAWPLEQLANDVFAEPEVPRRPRKPGVRVRLVFQPRP